MPRIWRCSSLLLCLFLAIVASPVRADLTWTTQTAVAGVNEDDNMASLSLTSTADPRIAYFDENAGTNETEVRFAQRVGGTWSNEFVANRGLNNKLGVSLKLTSGNDPRIAIFSFFEAVNNSFGDSRYASRTGDTWTVEDIKKDDDFVGEYIHLALTSTGSPRVASVNSTTSDLEYSTKESGAWVTTTIAARGVPAFIRLDSSDNPHVVFVDDDDNDALKIASNTTGTWTFDTVVEAFDSGDSNSASMVIRGSAIYLSFVDATGLRFAKKVGGTWVIETAVSDATLIALSSLGLDSNGNPFIAYETAGEEVKVAYKSGSAWVSSTVGEGTLNRSLGETLAIRGTTVGVVYTKPDESDLMYSYATIPVTAPPSTTPSDTPAPAGISGVFNDVFGNGAVGSGNSGDRREFFKENGFIAATVELDGNYKAHILLEGQKLSFSGKFEGTTERKTVNRPGKGPLHLTMVLQKNPEVRITGSIRTSGSPISFTALRGKFKKHPFAGRNYTVGIPAPSGTTAGTGYALITFGSSGNASVSGRLADGTTFSSTARTIDDGKGNWIVPVHAFLYTGNSGMLWGEFKLPKSPSRREAPVSGSLAWLRSSKAPVKMSPVVFLKKTSPRGARFAVKNGVSLLSGSGSSAEFEVQIDPAGKVLSSPVTVEGTWPSNNKPIFDTSGFSFSYNNKTGTFSGSVRHIEDGKAITIPFKGVLFGEPTNLGSGAGFFGVGRESGAVKIEVK